MRAAPTPVALILALAYPALSQPATGASAEVVRVPGDELTLLVNPSQDTPGIAVCVAWPSHSGQLSDRLARILLERGGRHETTRWAGSSL